MKIGTQIKVTDNSDYNGQDMSWTETYTGQKIIGKGGEMVYHQSNNIIKRFLSKEFCVHPFEHSKSYFKSNATKKEITSDYHWKIYLYSVFLSEGTVVDTYSDDEYRFELTSDMEVLFAGTIFEANGEIVNNVSTYKKYSQTK